MTNIHVQPPAGKEEAITPEIVTEEQTGEVLDLGSPDTIISMELKKFGDVNKETILAKKEEFKGLSIAGVEDKAGYEAVDKARKVMVKMRTSTENARKDAKSKYLKVGQGIDEYAGELKTLILEVENDLEAKIQVIDDAALLAVKEEERKQAERYQSRKEQVLAAGMVYTGTGYVIGEGGEALTIDEHALRLVDDETFGALVGKAETMNLAIVEAKMVADLEAEENRKKLEKQNEELRQMKEERRELRKSKLLSLGFQEISFGEYGINNRAADETLYEVGDLGEMDSISWQALSIEAEAKAGAVKLALEELEATEKEAEAKRLKLTNRKEQLLPYKGLIKDLEATLALSDGEFEVELANLETALQEQIKQQAENERLEEEKQRLFEARKAVLVSLGMEVTSITAWFRSKYDAENTYCTSVHSIDGKEAEFAEYVKDTIIPAIEAIQKADKGHEEKEVIRKEEERKALLTEAGLVKEWLEKIVSAMEPTPKVESPFLQDIVKRVTTINTVAFTELKEELEEETK